MHDSTLTLTLAAQCACSLEAQSLLVTWTANSYSVALCACRQMDNCKENLLESVRAEDVARRAFGITGGGGCAEALQVGYWHGGLGVGAGACACLSAHLACQMWRAVRLGRGWKHVRWVGWRAGLGGTSVGCG